MPHLPRLALATSASGMVPSPASLAWLAGLTAKNLRVQHFRSRACPTGTEAVGQVTGLPGRHLDSWLMPEKVLCSLFVRGARLADLSLIEGTLDDSPVPMSRPHYDQPGQLDMIAETLDLPIVAIVPCPSRESFHLPFIPERVEAIFLDGLENPEDYDGYRRMISLATRRPVIGAVESFPNVREVLRDTQGEHPITEELVKLLASSFLKFTDLDAIHNLARSRPFSGPECSLIPYCAARRFRVAYAQDEAFGAYFPDTLEALRTLGAELVEFSPLRDERLPQGVDLVMIGCGTPDLHINALISNFSLIAQLNDHVCRGNRIYSEGGGTAYLGREIRLPDGVYPGASILPISAVLNPDPVPPEPVCRTLNHDSWLGSRGSVVRGYRSGRWRLNHLMSPLDCPNCYGTLTAEKDLFFHHHAVGGLMHLHLGALPEVVAAFAGPHTSSLALPTSRPCR